MGDLIKGDLIRHESFGIGRVEQTSGYGEAQKCTVHFARSDRSTFAPRPELTTLSPEESTAYELVRLAVEEIRKEDLPAMELGERWKGGELVLKPADPALQPKILPIGMFFHKIVMVRNNLRVLEQKINGHEKLTDADKVEMQQYITRIYGSLTTFNVLFKEKKDFFVGQKGEDEIS